MELRWRVTSRGPFKSTPARASAGLGGMVRPVEVMLYEKAPDGRLVDAEREVVPHPPRGAMPALLLRLDDPQLIGPGELVIVNGVARLQPGRAVPQEPLAVPLDGPERHPALLRDLGLRYLVFQPLPDQLLLQTQALSVHRCPPFRDWEVAYGLRHFRCQRAVTN